jgi:hypothetical protein
VPQAEDTEVRLKPDTTTREVRLKPDTTADSLFRLAIAVLSIVLVGAAVGAQMPSM